MTVPMDNTSDLSSWDRAQHLYDKNVALENRRRMSAQARIPSDPNAWQHMRENYEAIVLEDHTFSEQHEIEYALWQLHYRRIEELRAHFNAAVSSTGSNTSQNGKGAAQPDRITKIRSQFKAFLSEATGFYHDVMLKIRAKYGLPLGYFSDNQEKGSIIEKDGNKSAETKKGLISCHRCLIYLGDLARYKGLYGEGDSKFGEFAAASSYYTQACSLLPSSGNPHHQLAILASYSGNELVAIYRYFRSLAADNPFSTARENLVIAFEKNRQSYSQLPGKVKPSPVKSAPIRASRKARGKGEPKFPSKGNKTEANPVKKRASGTPETIRSFSIRFVRLNGILFTRTSLETFGEVLSLARGDFLELLSSGPEDEYGFGSSATENGLLIVRLVAILIFTVHNVNKETDNQSYAEILQRSVVLQNAFTALFQFMGYILERCIQLHEPSGSCLLPGVLVFVEWLACHPDIAAGSNEVEEEQASARSFFWNNCISFMNKLLASGFMPMSEDEDETCFFNMSAYEEGETANRLALWEDLELRGFLPLHPAQLILDFSRKHSFGSDGSSKEKKVRIERVIAAVKALANVVQAGQQGISFDQKMKKFSSCVEPSMSDDALLMSSIDMPVLNHARQEQPTEHKLNPEAKNLPERGKLFVGEEDEEVIVFKPSITDKHTDTIGPKLTSFEGIGNRGNPSNGDSGNCVEPFPDLQDGFLVQNAFDISSGIVSSGIVTSVANIVPQQPQSIPPSTGTSKWLAETQVPIATGLSKLNIMDGGFGMKPEWHGSGAPEHAPFLPQSANLSVDSVYAGQVPETIIPSKFDLIMSSGASFDTLHAIPNAKKTPVSRPVRHFGPPPGFSTIPLCVDESLPFENPKNENLLMDDYSWLDGYQTPASTEGSGFNNTVSHPTSLAGPLSFLFPGTQVPTSRVQVEADKGQDSQFLSHLKLHSQQQQLQNGNQQFTPLQEQYNGQYMWDSHFFV